MAFPELRLLGRWTNTNASTGAGKQANTTWSPPPILTTEPALPQGMLKDTEVGEVALVVAYSPTSPNGAVDDLNDIQLVLDGSPYDYVHLSGRQDTSMVPPLARLRSGKPLWLGSPTWDRNGHPNDAVTATCPKFTESVTVNAIAGAAGIADDYTIDVYGYVYDAADLAALMPVYAPGDIVFPDRLNGRTLTIPGKIVTATGGSWLTNWKQLPGGTEQAISDTSARVFPLVRHARNANATAVSQEYQYQYQNSSESPAVQFSRDNLYFKLTKSQALIARRFGVKSPAPTASGAQLLTAYLSTPSEAQKRHPEGGIPADYNLGTTNFGLAAGETNKFDGVPDLPQGPQLIWGETGYPTTIDNGQSVAANAITVAFVATLIESGAGNVI